MSAIKQELPCSDGAPEELLGSLTTYSSVHAGGEAGGPAVRTSARVIKKLRLDSSDQRERKDSAKLDADKPEKEYAITSSIKLLPSKNASAKQRMPKALWSAAEKNLFFEALNEHGKDFDAITSYICTKLKRKGFTDATTKTKHQVSQFYYRTWNKVSKHIKFSDDVKKVVQELYALINYGEMRKRLELGVASRTASRLPELVSKGVVAVRERGRTLRVRTPVCRALRRLNQLEEWDEHLRLPSRVIVTLTPRDSEAWARVQGAAHNPRALAPAAPPLRMLALLVLLQRRWRNHSHDLRDILSTSLRKQSFESFNSLNQQIQMLLNPTINIQHSPLSLKIQNMPSLPRNIRVGIHELSKLNKSVGNVENNLDVSQKKDAKTNGLDGISSKIEDCTVSTEDIAQKSSNSVTQISNKETEECLDESFKAVESTSKTEDVKNTISSHVDNVANQKLNDSVSKNFQKWLETEERRDDDDAEKKWQVAYGTKNNLVLHVGPKPGLNLNFPTININEHVTSQRICLAAYQERIGNNPVNSSNGLQSELGFKGGGSRFKKRNRKDSGDNDPNKKSKPDGDNCDVYMKEVLDIDETANDGMDMVTFSDGKNITTDGLAFEEDKDFLSELEDDEKDNNETDGESDVPAKARDPSDDKNQQMDKFPNLKVKLRDRTKKDKSSVPSSITDSPEDPPRVSAATSNFLGKSWNRDFVLQQIKKGWSVYDAGDLTVGDMYLMFGSESKLELNYWWAEATPPIPPATVQQMKQATEQAMEGSGGGPVSGAGEEVSDRMLHADEILLSPTQHSSQDSNDIDERREMMSPDHKTIPHVPEDPSTSSAFPLVSKIINFPCQSGNAVQSSGTESEFSPPIVPEREKIVTIGGRLKKLLSIAKMHDRRRRVGCSCGHFCGGARGKRSTTLKDDTLPKTSASAVTPEQQGPSSVPTMMKEVFRAPPLKSVLLIQPANQQAAAIKTVADLELDKLPKWTRRGKQASSKPPVHKPKQAAVYRCPPILPRGPYVMAVPADAPAQPPAVAPAPLLRVLPAIRPRPIVPVVRQNIDRPPANFIKIEVPSQDSADVTKSIQIGHVIKSDSFSADQVTVYPSTSEGQTHWEAIDPSPSVKSEQKDVTPNLANLLDISLPSNIGDDNSLGIPLKVESNGIVEKHENFTGLLPAESMSMSPSRLLKDDQWLESEVHNFSLSSFLGHLEAGRGKGSEGVKGEESVDGHLHSLMGETSIDYMAKFEDLAARVGAEATK